MEKDLIFLGFLLLNNPIKEESRRVIVKLKQCGVESAMITGDNIYTALFVGMKTDIVEDSSNIWVG